MNYKLHNKYDAFTKVKNVIESCKTDEQLEVATAMLNNFKLCYKEDDNFLFNILKYDRWDKIAELVEYTLTKSKDD